MLKYEIEKPLSEKSKIMIMIKLNHYCVYSLTFLKYQEPSLLVVGL
jgi:hypothetical protein